MVSIIIPPINQRDTIKDVHPGSALPTIKECNPYIINITEIKIQIPPTTEIILNGRIEKDVMPSIAKLTMLHREYFDLPDFLS